MILTILLSYWFFVFLLVAFAELVVKRGPQITSARKRWPTNIVLILIAAGLASAVPISSFSAAFWAQNQGFGLLNYFAAGPVISLVATYVILSLWDYLVHLASHKVPLLWRFHKIHHSDQTLDVTTTFRVHPVMHLVLSGVNAGLAVTMGLHPAAIAFQAVVVLVIDLSHHTVLRIPPRLDLVIRPYIMTPALHHIHHSDLVDETDTNYGHDLAIWDRMFGTYLNQPLRPPDRFHYGLTNYPEDRANDLHALLEAPFRKGPFS